MSNLLGKSVMVYDKLEQPRTGYKGKVVMMVDEPKIRNMPQYGISRDKYVKFDDPDTILKVMGRHFRGWPVYYKDITTGTMTKGVIRSIDSFIKVAKDTGLYLLPTEPEYNLKAQDIECILVTDMAFDFEVCD